MTARQPTARGISLLLTRAGFPHYKHTLLRVWPGHECTTDAPGQVRVDYRGAHDDRVVKLGEYATAISAAGWAVDRREHYLIITAKGEPR